MLEYIYKIRQLVVDVHAYMVMLPLCAPIAQLVEQLTLNQWAQGSSPCGGTICVHSSVVEHQTFNLGAAGSSPAGHTN
jgi:hypothetical protein